VAGWLQHLSPGVSLVAHPVDLSDLAMLAFRYDTKGVAGRSDDSRPTNVGFGLTYCLPIVVACLASRPHSLILLENPEAHLHPRGQVALGTLLAKCAADNVQVVCETHSDHLLNGVRLAVKQKIVEPQKVRMHYFERALDTGECFVQSPEILASGELTNWPSGFFDQWQQSLDELLD
jgi:predicted ATPase